MRLVNLIPQEITLLDDMGCQVIPSSGHVKVTNVKGKAYKIEGITADIQDRNLREQIEGLPLSQEGVFYLVSPFVAAICRDRDDLLVAGIGPDDVVRRVIGGKKVIKTLIKITQGDTMELQEIMAKKEELEKLLNGYEKQLRADYIQEIEKALPFLPETKGHDWYELSGSQAISYERLHDGTWVIYLDPDQQDRSAPTFELMLLDFKLDNLERIKIAKEILLKFKAFVVDRISRIEQEVNSLVKE